jgi:hypothetical protein
MAAITTDRIAAVGRHVADAVTQTSAASTLPEAEQNRLLEQALGPQSGTRGFTKPLRLAATAGTTTPSRYGERQLIIGKA